MPTLKILIAEDDKVIQALYRKGLPENLCELRIAGDGEEAIKIYNEWRPDIILLDLGLPHINGFQTLKAIRTVLKDTTTTIIMVTSISEKSEIMACAKMGIQGYIVKPFKTGEIAARILQIHKEQLGKIAAQAN